MFTDIGFVEIGCLDQMQPFSPIGLMKKEEERMQGMRQNMLGYYFTHPAAFIKRLYSTATVGFANRYATIVWELR